MAVPRTFVYDPPSEPFLDILYEDEDMMAVNKPSGILSVPGKVYSDCIINRIRVKYPKAQAVHRLDYGTSGVMVVGLHKAAVSELGKQFNNRQTTKRYVAKAAGILEGKGQINLPLRTDLDNRPYQIVDFKDGREAVTLYESLYADKGLNCSWVKLTPLTGRSHQLRVHLKELGHPILGDHLYAPDEVYQASARLELHAYYLQICHPLTKEAMKLYAPPSIDLPQGIELKLL